MKAKPTKKRILRLCLRLLVILALLVLIPNFLVVLSSRTLIVSPKEAAGAEADCILVLGAGLRPDGSPSSMPAERINTGVALWKAGASPKLLMSGDHGTKGHDEVNAMKDAAMRAGVPSEAVFMDHAGFSTYDSMYRARDIFGAEKIVIVTQQYHLPRALWIARRMGLKAVGVACDTQRYSGQLYRDLREIAARDKDFVKCLRMPEPKYLGGAIPLTGSGDATNDRG